MLFDFRLRLIMLLMGLMLTFDGLTTTYDIWGRLIPNNRLFSVDGNVRNYYYDALGSTVAKADSRGKILWQENRLPFGKNTKLNDNQIEENPLQYTNAPLDTRSGLTYLQARDYNAEIGRFYAMDPVWYSTSNPQSFSRYAYANNNPFKYVDPTGMVSDKAPLSFPYVSEENNIHIDKDDFVSNATEAQKVFEEQLLENLGFPPNSQYTDIQGVQSVTLPGSVNETVILGEDSLGTIDPFTLVGAGKMLSSIIGGMRSALSKPDTLYHFTSSSKYSNIMSSKIIYVGSRNLWGKGVYATRYNSKTIAGLNGVMKPDRAVIITDTTGFVRRGLPGTYRTKGVPYKLP